MVNRKQISLILIILTVITVIPMFYFLIGNNESFIFIVTFFILIILLYSLLYAFFSLRKIFSKVKNELKVIEEKKKAVNDIYMYEQFLNPPEIDN
jgi:Na+/melibiose symporter-like transporter